MGILRAIEGPRWTHRELIEDLVNWLNGDDYIAAETAFGSRWLTNASVPDVLRLRKSYTRVDCAIYEVKTNRSDFLAEIRTAKWRDYLPMSSRLYFATPADGVVQGKGEIPDGVGWFVRTEAGWHARQAPRVREFVPSYEMALALLMKENAMRRSAEREAQGLKTAKHQHNISANKKMWERVHRVEREIQNAKSTKLRLRESASILREITGLTLEGWNWQEDLRVWAASKNGGVPAGHLDELEQHAREINRIVGGLRRQLQKSESVREDDKETAS